ncbi:hypothetical protein [Secundilactobacillus yichangensis]|uniref:hypothetical protein n=1 Tax=Secundilactobacillus yichangensis TaxID=2799580 RepID=UPI00194538E1|nr:hypothetical protein [Secundilactobacillus yichangensis]
MKKRMIIILITLVVVLATGWGAYEVGLLRWQPDNKTTKLHSSVKETSSSKAASSSQTSSQQSTADQLDKNKLTPQQTASALMYYAKHDSKLKYEKSWASTFDNSNENTVYITTIDIENLSKQGQNVRYAIGSSHRDTSTTADTDFEYPSYTLDADGTVHFYGNQDIDSEEDGKQVSPEASVTLSQVVAYINDQNAADQVKARANQLTIQDKRSAGEASTANVLTQKNVDFATTCKMLLFYANNHYHLNLQSDISKGAIFDVHTQASMYTYVMEQSGMVLKVHDQMPRSDPKIPGYYTFIIGNDHNRKNVTYGQVLKYVNQQGGRQALQGIRVNVSDE